MAEAIPSDAWLTVSGVVVACDDELTLETADGFHEDGEFKAGSVENLTSGQSILLRDETGRPMWAGRGRRATGDL